MIRIYFKDIAKAQLLGSTDQRYIRNWCKEMRVPVYQELNKTYVSHADFEIAYNSKITSDLKKNFPEDWEQRYRYYNYGEILELIKLRMSYYDSPLRVVHVADSHATGKYKPKSKTSELLIKKYLT